MLDVPVSGGMTRALTGDLSLFTAGAPAAVEDARPVLEALGNIIDCGPEVGQGQAYQAVNQLLCSVHIVAAAEALAFAEEIGARPGEVASRRRRRGSGVMDPL